MSLLQQCRTGPLDTPAGSTAVAAEAPAAAALAGDAKSCTRVLTAGGAPTAPRHSTARLRTPLAAPTAGTAEAARRVGSMCTPAPCAATAPPAALTMSPWAGRWCVCSFFKGRAESRYCAPERTSPVVKRFGRTHKGCALFPLATVVQARTAANVCGDWPHHTHWCSALGSSVCLRAAHHDTAKVYHHTYTPDNAVLRGWTGDYTQGSDLRGQHHQAVPVLWLCDRY
jgi:hypothetical protein